MACGAPGSTDYKPPSSFCCSWSPPSVRRNSRNQKDELRNTDHLEIKFRSAGREKAGALPVRVGTRCPGRTCHPVPRWPAPSQPLERGGRTAWRIAPEGRCEGQTSSPESTPGRNQVTSKFPDSPRGHRRGRSPDSMLPPRGQERDGRVPAERAAGRPSHARPPAGPGRRQSSRRCRSGRSSCTQTGVHPTEVLPLRRLERHLNTICSLRAAENPHNY